MKKTGFSVDRAAFFLFEERPQKTLLRSLGVVYVLVRMVTFVLVSLLALPFVWGALTTVLGANDGAAGGARQVQWLSDTFEWLSLFSGFLFIPVYVAIYTALLRWMTRKGPDERPIGLRFARQEWQVFLALIGMSLFVVAAALITVLPLVLLTVVTAGVWDSVGGWLGGFLVVATVLYGAAWFCGVIWFAVSLSPAPALTVQCGQVQVLKALRISKGHFWGLFLAYVLQFFIAIALSLAVLAGALLLAIPFLGVGFALSGGLVPDMGNAVLFAGLAFIPVVILSIGALGVNYLQMAMGAGVGACLVNEYGPGADA